MLVVWGDRECSRKPRLTGGVKGHTIIKRFLTGKPRPVGGELHCFTGIRWNMIRIERNTRAAHLSFLQRFLPNFS